MPQIDLVTYLYLAQLLYVVFWAYFAAVTVATHTVFQAKALTVFYRFGLVLPLANLYVMFMY